VIHLVGKRPDIVAAAHRYRSLGWRVVPEPYRSKKPILKGWPQLQLTDAEVVAHFSEGNNIAVVLGEASGNLADVDLDTPEARELAPRLLPPTWIFGRPGNPRSHWLFISKDAHSKQFRGPGPDRKMLLELRATAATGSGVKSTVPPSTHESGERIEWSEDSDSLDAPTEIQATALLNRCAKLAAAALIARVLGLPAAHVWINGGDFPRLPDDAMHVARRFLGLDRPRLRVIATPSPGDVVDRARRYLSRVPPAISGQGGHTQTLLAAQHLVRGFELDDELAIALLNEWNAQCVPPWSERELRHKVKQAREHGQAVEWGQHLKRGAV
jgi:hypothetical protein